MSVTASLITDATRLGTSAALQRDKVGGSACGTSFKGTTEIELDPVSCESRTMPHSAPHGIVEGVQECLQDSHPVFAQEVLPSGFWMNAHSPLSVWSSKVTTFGSPSMWDWPCAVLMFDMMGFQ